MKSFKKPISKLLSVCVLSFSFVACQKESLKDESGANGLQTNATTPRAATYSKNILFNSSGYNQFVSDLTSNGTSVKALFEADANASLKYTATAYTDVNASTTAEYAAGGDSKKVLNLALKAISLNTATDRQPYLDKAVQIIKAWASTNVLSWHRPKEAGFLPMYEGYSLIRPLISTTDKTTIDNWIKKRATTDTNNFGKQDGNAANKINNWEAMRLCFLFYSAYILDDATLLSNTKSTWNTFLNNFLHADGKTSDYNDRDAFAYQQYGLHFVGFCLRAINAYEGSTTMAGLRDYVNTKGVKIKNAISFWEPYLCGLYHDEFKNSIFSSERNGTRRGRYSPAGGVYVLDNLVLSFPTKVYNYISLLASSNSGRFANLTRYVSLLNNPSISASTGNVSFYQTCSYGGYNVALALGGYRPTAMTSKGIADNSVSAISVPSNRRAFLFDGDYYDETTAGGTVYKVNASTNVSCFSSTYNDKTGSIIVVGDY